jgi:hypothetical protein
MVTIDSVDNCMTVVKRLLCFGSLAALLTTLGVILIVYNWNKPGFLKSSCRTSAQIQDGDAKYKSVNDLISTGSYEEAKKELIEIIKKNKPDLKSNIPTNLCYLLDNGFDPSLGWLDKEIDNIYLDYNWKYRPGSSWNLPSIGHFKSWLMCLTFILNTILLIIAIIISWRIAISMYELISKERIYLDIKDFNDESIDMKIGKGTTSSLKILLLESNELGTSYNVNVALDPIDKFESPIETKELTTVLKLVNWVFRSTSFFTLSGYYQQSQEKGIGLKLVLKNSSEQIFIQDFWQQEYVDLKIDEESTESQDTGLKLVLKKEELVLKKEVFVQDFWQQEYVDLKIYKESNESIDLNTSTESTEEVTDLYELLAIPASIWVLSKLNVDDFKKWLGFKSWESYAYSRVGSYWYFKGNFSRSRKMLHKSLVYNSNNRFALFTLGVLEVEQNKDPEVEQNKDPKERFTKTKKLLLKIKIDEKCQSSIDHLDDQLKSLEKNIYQDPVYYKSIFHLLAIEQYIYQLKDSTQLSEKDKNKHKKIESKAERLVKIVGKHKNKKDINLITEYEEQNYNIVDGVERTFYKDKYQKKQNLGKFLDEFEVMTRIMYSLILESLNENVKKEEQIQAITNNKSYRLASFDKGDLFFDTENNQQENDRTLIIDCQVYYNLACLYALCIGNYYENRDKAALEREDKENKKDKMFEYLIYALKQDKSLAKWAKKDPSFDCIQKDTSELKSRFLEIINMNYKS